MKVTVGIAKFNYNYYNTELTGTVTAVAITGVREVVIGGGCVHKKI